MCLHLRVVEWLFERRNRARITWIGVAIGPLMLIDCASQSHIDKAPKPTAVTISCETSIDVGYVSAVFVSLIVSSENQVLMKSLRAVDLSGQQTAPLGFDRVIAESRSVGALVSNLNHMPSGSDVIVRDQLAALAWTSQIPMGLGLFALPVALPAAALSDASDLPARRLAEEYFGDPPYRPKGGRETYFLLSHPPTHHSGYLFFPRGNYTKISTDFGDYDLAAETVRNVGRAACPWR